MTMHVVAKNVLLSTILKTAETLKSVDVLPIKYSADGWEISMIDPARVAMIRMTIGKENFESYEADDGEAVINIKALKESVGFMPIENTVDVEFEDVYVTLRSGKIKRKIRMSDPSDAHNAHIPDLNPTCLFAFNTADIAKILTKATTVDTDAVTMVCTPEGLKFSLVTSDATESMDYVDETAKSPDENEYKSTYAREYLAAAFPALPQNVMVAFETDYPIIITSTAPFPITYLLAPRIESE